MFRSNSNSKLSKPVKKSKLDVDSYREKHEEFIKKNKFVLNHKKDLAKNVFTEEINKIALSDNDNKRIKLIDSIGTYAYGTSKDLGCKKGETKSNSIRKQSKND